MILLLPLCKVSELEKKKKAVEKIYVQKHSKWENQHNLLEGYRIEPQVHQYTLTIAQASSSDFKIFVNSDAMLHILIFLLVW